ncbi:MAG: hypothetical protein V9E82_10840 [Candidatus Nanopelagicales bacterium]
MIRTVSVLASLATAVAVLPAPLVLAAEPAPGAHVSADAQPVPAANRTARAGLPPQWVQFPYLAGGKRGRLTVVAKVYVDPKRSSTKRAHTQDRLRLRVAVAKKKYSQVKKPRSVEVLTDRALLARAHTTRKVERSGVMTLKVPLSAKVSKQLRERSFSGRRAAVAVSVTHRKDTKRGGSAHELTQISAGQLVKGQWSKRTVQQATAAAIAQRRVLRRSVAQGADQANATLASTPDTPYFNLVYVQNNTPFQQQITVQPVIQCLYAADYGSTTNAPPPATQETVNAGDSAVFTYIQPPFFPLTVDYPAGLFGAEEGLNAPGTQGTLTTDLVNSANAAGQSAVNALGEGSTYSQAGAVGAIAAATVKFLVSFFTGLKVDTCNNTAQYPQLFGVSSVVTGFGTNGVSDPSQAVLPPTNTWAGSPAAGNQGAFTDTPSSGFITGTLQQALGAQTNAVYYWNGGMPAPMVSPNASSGTYTGGSATFQDGLMQYVGPNPGFPDGAAKCQYNPTDYLCQYTTLGEMYIQLSYLTNPQYSAGLLNEGNPPIMTATADSTGNYTLRCDLSQMTATLTTPFGSGAPTTVEQSTLTNTPTNTSGQLPQDADWLVNFFGVTADGQPTYIEESVSSATDGINMPYLAPNAANQPVSIQAASAGGSQAVALGTVTPANMADMVTLDGTPAVPTQFGCTASPTISLPGLKVNSANGSPTANAYGNNWPVPTLSGKGWPSGYYGSNSAPFDFSWQKPVNELNVTFQGPALSAVTAVP